MCVFQLPIDSMSTSLMCTREYFNSQFPWDSLKTACKFALVLPYLLLRLLPLGFHPLVAFPYGCAMFVFLSEAFFRVRNSRWEVWNIGGAPASFGPYFLCLIPNHLVFLASHRLPLCLLQVILKLRPSG